MKKVLIILFTFLGLVFLASCSSETTNTSKTHVKVYFLDTNSSSLYPSKTLYSGNTLEKPDDPTKAGYSFKYWTSNGEEYDFSKPLESDLTLVANWDANSYTITLDKNGGVGEINETMPVTYNSAFTLPGKDDISRTGYEFVGWYLNTSKVEENNTFLYTSNITLKATWAPNRYTINYDADKGTMPAYTQTVYYDDAYQLYTPEKKGYSFQGWVDEDDNPVTAGTWNRTADLNLYAKWDKLKYTLTIDYIDENGDAIRESDSHSLYYGDYYNYEVPEAPGFISNRESVSGYMDDYNRTIVVKYGSPIRLTINYMTSGYADVAEPYEKDLIIGETYDIPTPFVDGYATNTAYVSGVMSDHPVSVTIYYLSAWDGTTSEGYAVGSIGTEGAPYVIQNADQLYYLAKQVNENNKTYDGTYFLLQNDINLSGKAWFPIGAHNGCKFNGHFDGAGHTIYGFKITEASGLFTDLNKTTWGYLGLFGKLGENASIKNLTVANYTINVNYANIEGANKTYFRVGGIVGMVMDSATITNVAAINGNVNIISKNGIAYGGIAGDVNNTTITNSYYIGNASLTNTSASEKGNMIGGIVGRGEFTTMGNIYSKGKLEFNSTNINHNYVGGIVGSYKKSRIYYGYSTMDITATINSYSFESHIAGIIAQNTEYIISTQNCFYEGNIIINATDADNISAGYIDTMGVQQSCAYLNNSALVINGIRSEYLRSERIEKNEISSFMQFHTYSNNDYLELDPNAVWIMGDYPTLYWQ